MSVISISINDELLDKLDKLLPVKGFSTRSELFREALRDYVTTEVWEEGKGPLVVTGMVITSGWITLQRRVSRDGAESLPIPPERWPAR